MPITVDLLFNRFELIAAALPHAMDDVASHAANTLFATAQDTSPVDTGAMQAAHRQEKIADGEYEVTVQKDEAESGEKTYALFVNGGTVHMAAQPWFSDACTVAAVELAAISSIEGKL